MLLPAFREFFYWIIKQSCMPYYPLKIGHYTFYLKLQLSLGSVDIYFQ
jgi:hypothetical protein